MRRRQISSACTAILISLALLEPFSAGNAPAATAPASWAFGPGEQSAYRIAYLGVGGGTAQVTVGADMQQWGKQVWPIVVIAKSDPVLALYPIRDKFVSFWDMKEQRTIGSELLADENHKRRREKIQFDHQAGVAKVVKQKEGEQQSDEGYEIEPGSFDMASAAFALRTRQLAIGRSFEIPIFTGHKSFILRATVEGKEPLRTAIGEKEVFKVRVETDFSGKFRSKRDIFGYFTTDPSHLLVRVEADFLLGALVAELTNYQGGRSGPVNPDVASSH
jgi:hypothetical protein